MTFRKPIPGRSFAPDNAELVRSSSGQQPTAEYRSEYEAYLADKAIATIMRERTSVCGRG
jgi:hypothetical protein